MLVCDADPHLVAKIAQTLGSHGLDPIHCHSGHQVLALAGRWRPALIIMDLILPDIDGLEVLKMLKSERTTKDIPVLIHTYAENADAALDAGAVGYLTKPACKDELVLCVKSFAAGRVERRRTVILAHRDQRVRDQLCYDVRKAGYLCVLESGAARVIEKVRQVRPNVLVIDLWLGGKEDWDLIKKLQEEVADCRAPIIVLVPTISRRVVKQARRFDSVQVADELLLGSELVSLLETVLREPQRRGTAA